MAAFVDVLGPALQSKDDELQTAQALDGKSAVGLYFVAPESAASEEFTAKLLEAYNGGLQQKGLEIVLVSPTIPIDGVADEFEPTKYPWLVLMFDDEEGHLEFVKKFEVQEFPKLVFFDPEAQVATTDGIARVTEDPAGEGFPWNDNDPKMLTEDAILLRLGPSPPEAGLDGLKGIFINNKKHQKLGLVDSLDEDESIPFSGMNPRPYIELDVAEILAEVQKIGFASDFHKHRQTLEKLEKSGGDKMLMFYDPDKTYGDKFTYVTSVPAYKREKERIDSARQEIIDAHLASLKKSEVGGEAGVEAADDEDDQDIVVRDGPKYGKEWVSEHMAKTHEEVRKFTLEKRSLLQVMITRTRQHFGKQVKFSDGPENVASCRPSKEPNFGVKRKELEIGIQAVKETADASCQTAWFRPVNKSTQYLPKHFLDELSTDHGENQIKDLTKFLQSVSDSVEEALQTNETVDIFREEFAHLDKSDQGSVSQTHSNIKELLFFYDVKFTKNKRIEWVEWVPGTTDVDMIACSCCDNQTFYEKVDSSGKVSEKTILIWSIQNALLPHSILLSPWDVPVFKFWPTDYHYVVGGLSSGQLAVWKVSDADLGLAHREKRGSGQDEEKGQAIPSTTHKQISVIDDSHKRAILAIEWLPASIEIVRRGKGAQDTNPKDGPRKYFVTLACDGQLMIWDFGALLESINDNDTPWKPIHRIQLQRQDSGTEMGCCHLLYCDDKVDEKGNKMLTNFYASTEEGEILFGDWAARTEEDRKPEFCKKNVRSVQDIPPYAVFCALPVLSRHTARCDRLGFLLLEGEHAK